MRLHRRKSCRYLEALQICQVAGQTRWGQQLSRWFCWEGAMRSFMKLMIRGWGLSGPQPGLRTESKGQTPDPGTCLHLYFHLLSVWGLFEREQRVKKKEEIQYRWGGSGCSSRVLVFGDLLVFEFIEKHSHVHWGWVQNPPTSPPEGAITSGHS